MVKKIDLLITVRNVSGVLVRLSSLFFRRGYSIDHVSECKLHDPYFRLVIISVSCDEESAVQIGKQVQKLVDVAKVRILTEGESVKREFMMAKLKEIPSALIQLLKEYGGRVLEETDNFTIVELADSPKRIETFIESLTPFGVVELIRTGSVILSKENSI